MRLHELLFFNSLLLLWLVSPARAKSRLQCSVTQTTTNRNSQPSEDLWWSHIQGRSAPHPQWHPCLCSPSPRWEQSRTASWARRRSPHRGGWWTLRWASFRSRSLPMCTACWRSLRSPWRCSRPGAFKQKGDLELFTTLTCLQWSYVI